MSQVQEIHDAILAQGEAWQEFKTANNARLSVIENELSIKTRRDARALFSPGSGVGGDSEYKQELLAYMRTGRESGLQHKAMTGGSNPEGGYLLEESMDTELTKYLRFRSPLRQLARVVKVDSYMFFTPHSTLGTQYTWTGETGARPGTVAPSFKMLEIPTFEVYAMPAITQNLLDDNIFNLENWLIEELGEAFGDAESSAFINGDGVAKPRGLFTYGTVSTADATRAHDKFQYTPTGNAGAFATSNPSDALITLVYSLAPQYRQNAAWLMSPEVLEQVRRFKASSTNEYLWQPSNQAGQPATLMGYPIYEDVNLPAIAANSLSCAFGDFSRAYTITDRSTALLRDPYTSKPYVNFYCTKRLGGGGGRDTRAVKFLKFAAS